MLSLLTSETGSPANAKRIPMLREEARGSEHCRTLAGQIPFFASLVVYAFPESRLYAPKLRKLGICILALHTRLLRVTGWSPPALPSHARQELLARRRLPWAGHPHASQLQRLIPTVVEPSKKEGGPKKERGEEPPASPGFVVLKEA